MEHSLYMESTPNPSVMKFVSNKILISQEIELLNKKDALLFPIANAIFDFPFVKKIFISKNFLSISKDETVEWQEIGMHLRSFILEKLNTEKMEAKEAVSNKEATSLEEKKENRVF